jgi:hypothetical protein
MSSGYSFCILISYTLSLMIQVSGGALIWPHWKARFHGYFPETTHVTHQNLYTPFTCTAITHYVGNTEELIYSDHDNMT